ncbi:hypothetical protein GCM10020001_004130 [Nonomuraea salmonea]
MRHIGLSEVGAGTIRRAAAVAPICDVQIEYSLFSRGVEDEILAVCRELGIGVTAYGVLSRGLIGGSGTVAGLRAGSPRFQGANLDHNAALAGRLQDLAAAKGVSVAQLAIAWVAAQGDDIVPIVGSRTPDQVTTMIAADAVTFTAQELALIEDLVPPATPPRATATPQPSWPPWTANAPTRTDPPLRGPRAGSAASESKTRRLRAGVPGAPLLSRASGGWAVGFGAAAEGGVGECGWGMGDVDGAEVGARGTISSMRSSRSSPRVTEAPARRSSSCSMVRGPMIAELTPGWAIANAIARCVSGSPASSASGMSRSTASSLRSSVMCRGTQRSRAPEGPEPPLR